MKAAVRHMYGDVGQVAIEELPEPSIGDHEVLVRVHAAGLDRGVVHILTGQPYLMRVAGFGIRAPKNPILGRDLAGIVEAVGSEVTRFQVGDEVYGVAEGSYVELAAAAEDKLAPKPGNLTFEQAAAVPISALTALQAVADLGEVGQGQRVLVIGASGGVGTYAVQLARARGAVVTGVAGTSKLDLVESLGAERVIDYSKEDFADGSVRYDVIVDIAGNTSLKRLRGALTAKGTLVIVGGEGGGRWFGGIDRQLRAMVMSPFVGQRLRTFIATESGERLEELTRLIEAGEVTPVVDRTFPLTEVPAAIGHMLDNRARGKVVIHPISE